MMMRMMRLKIMMIIYMIFLKVNILMESNQVMVEKYIAMEIIMRVNGKMIFMREWVNMYFSMEAITKEAFLKIILKGTENL